MLHTGSDPIICLKAQDKHFDAWLLYGKATEARFGCSRGHCKAELVFRSRDFLVDGLAGTGKCEFGGAFQMQGDLCPRHGPGIPAAPALRRREQQNGCSLRQQTSPPVPLPTHAGELRWEMPEAKRLRGLAGLILEATMVFRWEGCRSLARGPLSRDYGSSPGVPHCASIRISRMSTCVP